MPFQSLIVSKIARTILFGCSQTALFWLRRGITFGMNWVLLEVFGTSPSAWEGISM